jgi:uncharacterized protein HemX
MKKQLLIIGALVVSISIIGWLYYQKKKKNTYVYNDTTIAQVEYTNAVAKNKELQAQMDSTIAVLNDSIIALNEMVNTKTNQIQTLKNKRNEKNNNIAKFSAIDLTNFLSNFYKDSVK